MKQLISKLNNINLSKFTRESLVILVLKIAGRLTGYILILIITQKYGAYTMGTFALTTTLLTIISIFGRFGSDLALLKFVGELSATSRWHMIRETYRKILILFIPLCLILSILFFLSSEYLARYVFKNDSLSFSFKLISFAILPLVIIGINSEGLRGLKKTKEYAFLADIAVPLFSIIFLLLSFSFVQGKHIPVIAYGISVILVFFLSQAMWNKGSISNQLNGRSEFPNGKECIDIKTIFKVSSSMLLAIFAFLVISWTDILMLGIFRNEGEVGIYNVASRLSKFASMPLLAILAVTAPKVSASYANQDPVLLKDAINQSARLIFWTSFPIILIFLLFPSFLMNIFGQEFRLGAYALIMLSIGEFINSISGPAGFILQMTGKEMVFRNIMILTCILNISLNAILIPKYGFNGAAFATMISMAFVNITSVIYVRIYTNITPIYVPFLKSIKKTT